MSEQFARWYNKNDGLVHLGPEASEEDDLVFTLCSEEGRLLARWWMDKQEGRGQVATCLRCLGWRGDDAG